MDLGPGTLREVGPGTGCSSGPCICCCQRLGHSSPRNLTHKAFPGFPAPFRAPNIWDDLLDELTVFLPKLGCEPPEVCIVLTGSLASKMGPGIQFTREAFAAGMNSMMHREV